MGLLYKYSYISIDPIKALFVYGSIKSIFFIILLTFSLTLILYIRFIYCQKIFKIKINFFEQLEISSQAYGFAGFLPGQVGIDVWRISKLRRLDLTKFKTILIRSTILEKIFALFSQLFVLIIFILNTTWQKTYFAISTFLLLYLLINILNRIGERSNFVRKYTNNINFKNISSLFIMCIILNLLSCYLITLIATNLDMIYSLKVMSISSILSNITTVIPLSPSGLGISEFVFSEVTQNITNMNSDNSISTIYFSYRVLNLLSHFAIYYVIKLYKFWDKEKRRNFTIRN